MSWLFSRALVEGCLALMPVGSERSALSNVIGTVDACLSGDKTSEPFQPFRYGMTFAPLTENHGELAFLLFPAASHVNRSVRLHEAGEQQ